MNTNNYCPITGTDNCFEVICHSNCSTCSTASPSACLTCADGNATADSGICSCNDEYYNSGISPIVTCSECKDYCKTCNDNATCDECISTHSLH